ncbi:enhancer of split mgamma protein-like [Musca vetustissima]|uniref:enhancer of split mgamma protein-like n=1 Tax=Musca vetustissima TaxID=27455 RepID=UPI002AB6AD52|nr:enhancer of split mgamma protein-like [Musca vetustissima]
MNFTARMPPNHQFMLNSLPMEPVSRTYQYRKIMKPMLERKRRARINKCLDELKELMTGTLQADGENVSKLEKADILELTVRHLQRLREKNALYVRHNDTLNMEKFWAGFQHCAAEVAQYLNKFDHQLGGDLIQHITSYAPNINAMAVSSLQPNVATRLPSSAYLANRVVTANYQRLPLNNKKPLISNISPAIPNSGNSDGVMVVRDVHDSPNYSTEHMVKKELMDDHDRSVWRPW